MPLINAVAIIQPLPRKALFLNNLPGRIFYESILLIPALEFLKKNFYFR